MSDKYYLVCLKEGSKKMTPVGNVKGKDGVFPPLFTDEDEAEKYRFYMQSRYPDLEYIRFLAIPMGNNIK